MESEGTRSFEIPPSKILAGIDKISLQTGIKSFVIFGSSSNIVYNKHRIRSLPEFLRKTKDVDLTTNRETPTGASFALEQEAVKTVFKKFGEDSPFKTANKFYFELTSPWTVKVAPEGWEARAKSLITEAGVEVKIINPIDCAALKLAVGRPKDITWLANCFAAKLFTPKQLEKHVTGHTRYAEFKDDIAKNLKLAAISGKKLSQNRERD